MEPDARRLQNEGAPTRSASRLRRVRVGKVVQKFFWAAVVGVFAVIVLAPIVEMVFISLSPMSSIDSGALMPVHWMWSNYVEAWGTVDLLAYLENSILVSVISTLLTIAVALGVSFVLERFYFRFRSLLAKMILFSQMIPGIALLLPIYLLYSTLQNATHTSIIGSFPALISVYVGISVPLATWLLIGAFNGIPKELDEAAYMDGANNLTLLVKVLVPVALPGIAVAAIFSFLGSWNDLLFSSVMTNNATRTLAIGLQEYVGAGNGGGVLLWNQLMAAAVMSSIPAVLFFLAAQRLIVQGLSAGAVRQ